MLVCAYLSLTLIWPEMVSPGPRIGGYAHVFTLLDVTDHLFQSSMGSLQPTISLFSFLIPKTIFSCKCNISYDSLHFYV